MFVDDKFLGNNKDELGTMFMSEIVLCGKPFFSREVPSVAGSSFFWAYHLFAHGFICSFV
jgi:hypothetical protein